MKIVVKENAFGIGSNMGNIVSVSMCFNETSNEN